MPATWTHPELGEFTFEKYLGWRKLIDVPAFQAFSYRYSNGPRSTGRHELTFEAEDENDLPAPGAIALASTLIKNQSRLVTNTTEALWDDFNGRGPESGMWWHGALDEVTEEPSGPDELPPLDSPKAMLSWLRLSEITIRKPDRHYDGKTLAELSLVTPFEEEHGVGVLTDGEQVLGTGYCADVRVFKELRNKR